MENKLELAKRYAQEKHKGQKDDDGNDYYTAHLIPVLKALEIFSNDEEVLIAGVLHDIIEDCDVTYDMLVEKFGIKVADLVNEVTHEGTADNVGYYFPRLHSQNGILIKLCDRASNISRMDSWKQERKDHYLKRTKFWKSNSVLMGGV